MKKPETNKQRNHRYYLHRRVKRFTQINAKNKQVEINDKIIESITLKQKQYLSELKILGYSLQYNIV